MLEPVLIGDVLFAEVAGFGLIGADVMVVPELLRIVLILAIIALHWLLRANVFMQSDLLLLIFILLAILARFL
jgi:hypothetical protein